MKKKNNFNIFFTTKNLFFAFNSVIVTTSEIHSIETVQMEWKKYFFKHIRSIYQTIPYKLDIPEKLNETKPEIT